MNLPAIATAISTSVRAHSTGAIERVDLGLEAGDDEEQRQQDEDDEVLEARADVGRQAGAPGHDQTHDEGAEDRRDPDLLRDVRRQEDADEDAAEPERRARGRPRRSAFETRSRSLRPISSIAAVKSAASATTLSACDESPLAGDRR